MSIDHTALKARLAAAHRLGGRGPEQARPPTDSIGHLAHRNSVAYGPKPVLIHYHDEERRAAAVYSHESFADYCHRVANYLGTLGVGHGQTVATLTMNHAETLGLYAAAWIIGARMLPLNPWTMSDDQIRRFLIESQTQTLFVHSEFAQTWERVHKETANGDFGRLENVIRIGTTAPGTISFRERVGRQSPRINVDEPPDLDDGALLVYTELKQGEWSAVELSQAQLLQAADGLIRQLALNHNDVFLTVQPLVHAETVVMALLVPMLVGGTVVIDEPFTPKTFWRRIAKEQVTTVHIEPEQVRQLLETEFPQGDSPEALSGMEPHLHPNILLAGKGMDGKTMEQFVQKTGLRPLPGYSRPEFSGFSTLCLKDAAPEEYMNLMQGHPGARCVGTPLPCNEVLIVDENGKTLPPGEKNIGTIMLRGWNLMSHYAGADDANYEAFSSGWFDTGDRGFALAYQNTNYYFLIEDEE